MESWYQIRFYIGKILDKKITPLTSFLLNKYIENILNENKNLQHPFIIDIFALNQKNNIFDTSLPPLLFLNCIEYNDKLLNHILEKAGVQYIKYDHVISECVNQYRILHEHTQNTVWSGAYMTFRRVSRKNLVNQINELPNKINDSAAKLGCIILDIVCPNIEIFKHDPDNTSPVIVYIQHYANENDKIMRLLSFSKFLINIPTETYTYMIATVNEQQVINIKNTSFEKTNIIEFKPESKVKIISGSMESLIGTVISQKDDIVIVNINILGNSIEVTFNKEDLVLV